MEIHPYKSKIGFKNQLKLEDSEVEKLNLLDGGIWFSDTKTIICGTFPPRKEYFNRKGYLHYSSPRNKFWQHVDALFDTKLFVTSEVANNTQLRIKNALEKIHFAKKNKIGFVDIFTQISRKNDNSSKDSDIIMPYATIFDNQTFLTLIENSVVSFVFVYSKSYDIFVSKMKTYFPDLEVKKVRDYGKDNITLKVESCCINSKTIYLLYCPIHGRISDEYRRPALKKAIINDYD